MIKLKLSQLVMAVTSGSVKKLEEQVPPGAYKFQIAKLTDAVLTEYQRYIKQQDALVRKYGVHNKETGQISIGDPKNTTENVQKFGDEVTQLLELEVELPFEPISYTKLGPKAQEALSVGDVRGLGPLLVE